MFIVCIGIISENNNSITIMIIYSCFSNVWKNIKIIARLPLLQKIKNLPHYYKWKKQPFVTKKLKFYLVILSKKSSSYSFNKRANFFSNASWCRLTFVGWLRLFFIAPRNEELLTYSSYKSSWSSIERVAKASYNAVYNCSLITISVDNAE